MTQDLRFALYSPVLFPDGSRLDEVLVEAVISGRDVVITGTAGGGKTMLVDQIVQMLEARNRKVFVLDDEENVNRDDAEVIVIRDLTAVGPDAFLDCYDAEARPPLLLAANEGALMDERLGGRLHHAIDDLHRMQQGFELADDDGPVVIDMAAIDPVSQALPALLSNQLLHAAVRLASTSEPGADRGIRVAAMGQLGNSARVSELCDLARRTLGPGEVTFRELWNFLADVFLGGTDLSVPPTSAWFWRFFYGDSTLAGELRSVLRPEFLALPDVSLKLYRGDFRGLGLDEERQREWVHPGEDPNRAQEPIRQDLIRWTRLQYVVLQMGQDRSGRSGFLGQFSLRYSNLALATRGKNEIAQALNNYFKSQHSDSAQFNGLELWVDLMVERRTYRSHLVSLGRVPSISLSIGTSLATGRTPGRSLKGSRVFLHAGETPHRVSLGLSAGLFVALFRGRSLQTFERANDDIDLAIRRFFLAAASATPLEQSDVLRVLYVDDEDGAREIAWQVTNRLQLQDSY